MSERMRIVGEVPYEDLQSIQDEIGFLERMLEDESGDDVAFARTWLGHIMERMETILRCGDGPEPQRGMCFEDILPGLSRGEVYRRRADGRWREICIDRGMLRCRHECGACGPVYLEDLLSEGWEEVCRCTSSTRSRCATACTTRSASSSL